MVGATVSMVTNEPVSRSLSVKETRQISISVNGDVPGITATIKEGDPNYGEKTITINGSTILDDTSIPEVYPFTYTARNDTAGNLGQSVTINVIWCV